MPHWKATVKLGDLHESYQGKIMTVPALAKAVADRLKRVRRYQDDADFQDIVVEFEGLAEDEDAGIDDYDCILGRLYDFGDSDHRLWVDTF